MSGKSILKEYLMKRQAEVDRITNVKDQIRSLYCDGGLLGSQKKGWGCETGGTWAWVGVGEPEVRTMNEAGTIELGGIDAHAEWLIFRAEVILATEKRGVTNNHTEQIAIIKAMEAMNQGWEGTIHTDSRTALLRVQSDHEIYRLGKRRKPTSEQGLPQNISERSKIAVTRLGEKVKFVLLQGHPTEEDIRTGIGAKRNLPVSRWNEMCDDLCNQQKDIHFGGDKEKENENS